MKALFAGVLIVGLIGAASAQAAPDQASASAALAQADASAKKAGEMGAQWNVTVKALKAAHTAAESADYATAQTEAEKADTLAKLSIEQAKEQKTLWRNEAIK